MIGNDVWLAADCTILSGVTIGDGAVIGAGAMMSRDIDPSPSWPAIPDEQSSVASLMNRLQHS